MTPDPSPWAEEHYVKYLEMERHLFAWCLVTYGKMSQVEATAEAIWFYCYEAPEKPCRGLVFHDMAWHWAMLNVVGPHYWKSNPELLKPTAEYKAEAKRFR